MPHLFTRSPAVYLARTLAAAALTWAATAHAAGPTTQFTVGGQVLQPGSYNLASLQALPASTQTVNFLSGSTPQTHTYVGTRGLFTRRQRVAL